MKLVVALGGNALGNTPLEQQNLVKSTAKAIVNLIKSGNQVVVTHGNGPQVGMINNAFNQANCVDNSIPLMPFPECNAMSQGYIGYHLQNAIQMELHSNDLNIPVVSLVTQVLVSKDDKAFDNPTKPIGAFVSKEQALLMEQKGYVMRDFGQKGFRRVVPSPKPLDIIEKDVVKQLIDSGCVVITVGGGGIPVIDNNGNKVGVDSVIDKDFASALLAKQIDADKLIILTAVDKVSLNFNSANQIDLDVLTVSQAEEYIKQQQFGNGSMLPKVLACIEFAKSGKQALIANLNKVDQAILNKSGTKIVNN